MAEDMLRAWVAVPSDATALEQDGMLKRLDDALVGPISDHVEGSYGMLMGIDNEGLHVEVSGEGLGVESARTAVEDALAQVLAQPDVPNWIEFNVETVPSPGPETENQATPTVLEAVTGSPGEALNLSLDDDLVEMRARLRRDGAQLLEVLEPQWLTNRDIDDPTERRVGLVEAEYVAGALYAAAILLTDYLFLDLDELVDDTGRSASMADVPNGIFHVLDGLPRQHSATYNQLFVRKLIIAVGDLTTRLSAGWQPLACVAQELCLRMLLDQAEAQLDLAEVDIPSWRNAVEDSLFEDVDHEFLYEPRFDGVDGNEIGEALGMAPMSVSEWFRPFNPSRKLPPYLLGD